MNREQENGSAVTSGLTKSLIALSAIAFVACAKSPNNVGQLSSTEADSGIIGGAKVGDNDPISKSVVIVYDTQQGALCTGSIIAADLVVTAGHCFNEDPTKLVLIFGTQLPTADTKVVGRRVASGVVHPHFAEIVKLFQQNPKTDPDSIKDWGDVSVLRFAGGLPAGYVPAELLTSAALLKNGEVVTLAGYGEMDGVKHQGSDSLRKVDVQIVDAKFAATEVQMDQRNGKGACHGDSGGPAYARVGGKTMLFGVTSRGVKDPKNECSTFSVYTNVASEAHQKFLLEAAKVLRAPAAVKLTRN